MIRICIFSLFKQQTAIHDLLLQTDHVTTTTIIIICLKLNKCFLWHLLLCHGRVRGIVISLSVCVCVSLSISLASQAQNLRRHEHQCFNGCAAYGLTNKMPPVVGANTASNIPCMVKEQGWVNVSTNTLCHAVSRLQVGTGVP